MDLVTAGLIAEYYRRFSAANTWMVRAEGLSPRERADLDAFRITTRAANTGALPDDVAAVIFQGRASGSVAERGESWYYKLAPSGEFEMRIVRRSDLDRPEVRAAILA